MKSISALALTVLAPVAGLLFAAARAPDDQPARPTSDYAEVNGLRMYYEIHGTGEPLVLLHGGLSTIESTFAKVLPSLAKTRQVIAIEQQGHGHTADIDRPLSYEQMADDTDALLKHLKVENADFFGWSDGANVTLQLAIRHLTRVRKLVLLGACIDSEDALEPEILAWVKDAKPEDFGPEVKAAYTKAAPNPAEWPTLIAKLKLLWTESKPMSTTALQSIEVPVLVMAGDRGGDRPEHAVRLYRTLPNAQLAVLPGTSRFALLERAEWVLLIMGPFLDAPTPEAK